MYANDDYKDFWNEYKLVQETKHTATTEDEDHTKLEVDEVENDTELLRVMGMGHLVEVFNQSRQITDQQLDMSLRQLSKRQADTVRKRVRALNYTVKSRAHLAGAHVASRTRGWQRKPDIRNVFKSDVDVEAGDVDDTGNGNDSTGTRSRSRSATPDSLDFDSIQSTATPTTSDWNATNWNTSAATSTQHGLEHQSAHTNNHHPHQHPSNNHNLVGSVPSFVKIFHQSDLEHPQITSAHRSSSESEKDTLRRTPSAPPSCNRNRGLELKSEDNCDTSNTNVPSILPSTEMFGRPNWSHYREAVASNSEGIELLGFNRIGTMYCPRNSRERGRLIRDTQSDTQASSMHRRNVDALIDSPTPTQHAQSPFHPSIPSNGPMSFEMAFNNRSSSTIKHEESLNFSQNESNIINIDVNYSWNEQRLSVNQVTDLDFKDMTPMLWLEICMLFDKHSLKIHRRKPLKRKRKEDGNLFGVNLSTLVMRDYQFINNDNDHMLNSANANANATDNSISNDAVPLIIRDLLSRLSDDARLKEEGLLRVAGNKQRVEVLCVELEQHYYNKQESCKVILSKSTSHELVSILKKILRDLPQPLFTTELIHLFYETHAIQDHHDQLNALNLLILLLPVQNRTTLYALLEFFIQVVRHQHFNKMNLHNVAMIIAPSLFPPRYIFTTKSHTKNNDLNSEIAFAATCCKLTETLIENVQLLQTIPVALLKQARTTNNTTSTRN